VVSSKVLFWLLGGGRVNGRAALDGRADYQFGPIVLEASSNRRKMRAGI